MVASYNAQVERIRRALDAAGFQARVGTVDKFRGQEAPVAIYSLPSSSAEDAPQAGSSTTRSTASSWRRREPAATGRGVQAAGADPGGDCGGAVCGDGQALVAGS